MAKRQEHPSTPALTALVEKGAPFKVHEFEHNSAQRDYGEECVAALGVAPDRVFKTLVLEAGKTYVVAVLPVTRRADLKMIAKLAGTKKVALAQESHVTRSTGYVLGGVSPFGQRQTLNTFVDESVTAYDTVFVSGGRRGLEIEIEPSVLIQCAEATIGAISRAQ